MLEHVKQYIESLPDIDFNTYYQDYVFAIQDENLEAENQFNDPTFNDISKIIAKIHKELGNIV